MQATEIELDKGSMCRAILNDLPEWFGIAAANDADIAAACDLPMLGLYDGREPVAFLSQVKTLAPSCPDPYDARTRAFYEAVDSDLSKSFPNRGVPSPAC